MHYVGVEAKPSEILKEFDQCEYDVYARLDESFKDDPIKKFMPSYLGIVDEFEGKFLKLSNLLHEFIEAKVMDVKIGVRTFLESECKCTKPRPDLFKRMTELYPELVTDEERSAGFITKHRWMTVRDSATTISALGYRIDGVAGYRFQSQQELAREFAQFTRREDARVAFARFARVAATDDGEAPASSTCTPRAVAERILNGLREFQVAMAASPFVARHSFTGSSLLLIADATGKTGVYWIDFAKTLLVPEDMEVTHWRPWIMGNHEDGAGTGVGNLIDVWGEVVEELSHEEAGLAAAAA